MYWTLYVLNLIFGAISYKLGFARKLSLGKNIIVYFLLAIGTLVITVFSIFKLPITESLIITTIVLAIYRFRYIINEKTNKKIHNLTKSALEIGGFLLWVNYECRFIYFTKYTSKIHNFFGVLPFF